MSVRDRMKGCFYGLAIGDALGAAVEFSPPGTFPPVTGYRDGGPHDLAAGEWTDDTSMALALADSLACKGWDVRDQLERYAAWADRGEYSVNGRCFDIGNQTWRSIQAFKSDGRVVADRDNRACGNGSIMRLAPLAIWTFQSEVLEADGGSMSATTHNSAYCRHGCEFLHELLDRLFQGEPRGDAVAETLKRYDLPLHDYSSGDVQGSGYVIDSLKAALWAFMTSASFEDAVLKAVNLGDDADTTGAVCGQLAGAYWGFDAIPAHLVEGLARRDMIDRYLEPILPLQ